MRYSTENLFGNILLFFPLGIFLPLLFNKTSRLSKMIFTVFLISFCLELIQLVTVLGNFDTDDIILNVLGSVIGFGVYKILATAGQT
jgi:glycopeptide antibiotics resistance protein